MGKGFDCAQPLSYSKALEFVNAGYTFVCRYYGHGYKVLTLQEAKDISRAGLWIVVVFETTANRAAGGWSNGIEDANLALACAAVVQQPLGRTIYFAVDFEAQDMGPISDYFNAIKSVVTTYNIRPYGSYAVVKYLLDNSIVDNGWQTIAWSYGQRLYNVALYQSDNDVTELGIGLDHDESNGDAGGWKYGEEYKMTVEDANSIIDTYLTPEYMKCDSNYKQAIMENRYPDADAWLKLRNYQHYLANELRKASNQSPT